MRQFVRECKSNPCVDCGNTYPYYVMDYDHRDPGQKTNEISRLQVNRSLSKLKEEIAKCDLVCSNCHRIRTHMRSWPDGDAADSKPVLWEFESLRSCELNCLNTRSGLWEPVDTRRKTCGEASQPNGMKQCWGRELENLAVSNKQGSCHICISRYRCGSMVEKGHGNPKGRTPQWRGTRL